MDIVLPGSLFYFLPRLDSPVCWLLFQQWPRQMPVVLVYAEGHGKAVRRRTCGGSGSRVATFHPSHWSIDCSWCLSLNKIEKCFLNSSVSETSSRACWPSFILSCVGLRGGLRLCISDMVVFMLWRHKKHVENQGIYWSGRLLNIPIRFWLHSQWKP